MDSAETLGIGQNKQICYVDKIVIFIIFLQPFINNFNGFTIKFFGVSVVGPVFYSMVFLFFAFENLKISSHKWMALTLIWGLYIVTLVGFNKLYLKNLSSIFKVYLPVVVFFFFKNSAFSKQAILKLTFSIYFSIITYSVFILFTFLINFKYYDIPSRGYQGFVFASNDLIVLFLITTSFSVVSKSKLKYLLPVSVISLILIKTKFLFILIVTVMFVRYKKGLILSILPIFSIIVVFWNKIEVLLDKIILQLSFGLVSYYDLSIESIVKPFTELRFLFFGRLDFLDRFLSVLSNFTLSDRILGVGVEQSIINTLGKGGIEMDIFDSYHIYGLVGVVLLVLFYYLPPFFSNVSFGSKIIFCLVILYSVLGGHFFNNPICGFYYGVIWGLLLNKKSDFIYIINNNFNTYINSKFYEWRVNK